MDDKGADVISVEEQISKRIMDTDPNRIYQVWEQPLYRYGANGPESTGYNRRVSYDWKDTSFDLWGGDELPYVVGFLGGVVIGAACAVCGVAVEILAAGSYFNSAIGYEHYLQVDYTSSTMCFESDVLPPADLRK